MDYAIIILSSVTHANRVKSECEKKGIFASVGHTPKSLSKKGCSFMVRVKLKDLKYVKEIVDKLLLKTYGIYRQSAEGRYDIL